MTVAEAVLLSRRERKKLEVRGRISEAALALFDERGFHTTTVAEICERADVADKTFFNYFPSKRHLLREVAKQALARLLAMVEEVRREPGTTTDRLQTVFTRIAEQTEAAGPLRRELLTEMIHVGHEAHTEPEQARQLQAGFASLVRRGRSEGDVSSEHALESQTEVVLGAFYALMFNWAHFEGYALRRRAQALARLVGEAISAPEQR